MIAVLAGTATLGVVVQALVAVLLLAPDRAALPSRLPVARRRPRRRRQDGQLDLRHAAPHDARRARRDAASSAARPAATTPRRRLLSTRLADLHAAALGHHRVDRDRLLHAHERARRRATTSTSCARRLVRHPRHQPDHRARDRGAHRRAPIRSARSSQVSSDADPAIGNVIIAYVLGLVAVLHPVRPPAHLLRPRRHPHSVLLHAVPGRRSSSSACSLVPPAPAGVDRRRRRARPSRRAASCRLFLAAVLLRRRLGGHRRSTHPGSLWQVPAARRRARRSWSASPAHRPRRHDDGGFAVVRAVRRPSSSMIVIGARHVARSTSAAAPPLDAVAPEFRDFAEPRSLRAALRRGFDVRCPRRSHRSSQLWNSTPVHCVVPEQPGVRTGATVL